MSGITLLRAADRRPQRWKNGGGVTREVLVHPPGAAMDSFLWRISIADVEQDGDFSCFTGVDRIMAILSGRLELTVEGESVVLDPASEPLPYPGDVPTSGRPLGGMVRDLNLMVRRGDIRAAMRRLVAPHLTTSAPTTLCLAEQAMSLRVEGEAIALMPLDALCLAPGMAVAAEGSILLIEITDSAAPHRS
jgi:environmental stress-induced protein Ves